MATSKRKFICDICERPSKRRRIVRQPSLDDVNDDCLRLILKHLPANDLNSMAMCGRHYRAARSHESLDQARTGTILCSTNTSLTTIYDALVKQGMNQARNRSTLKLVNIENVPPLVEGTGVGRVIPHICSLAVSFRHPFVRTVWHQTLEAIIKMLPNLEEIDFADMICHGFQFCNIERDCRMLKRFSWSGSFGTMRLNGGNFAESSSAVTELYLDDTEFSHDGWHDGCSESLLLLHEEDVDLDEDIFHLYGRRPEYHHGDEDDDENHNIAFEQEEDQLLLMPEEVEDLGGENRYMFRQCRHLQRLSITNATWRDGLQPRQQVTQDMLIDVARHHPTLRWLKSDLTEENIAMIQREKPEMIFVSE